MPGRPSYLDSQRTFYYPSLPFYLKAFFLASLSTEVHADLRKDFYQENLPSGISFNSVVSRDDTGANSIVLQMDEMPVAGSSAWIFPNSE